MLSTVATSVLGWTAHTPSTVATSVLGWTAHTPIRTIPSRHRPPQLMWTAHGRLQIELEAITATTCAFQSCYHCALKAGSAKIASDELPETAHASPSHAPPPHAPPPHAPPPHASPSRASSSLWRRLPRWRRGTRHADAETAKRALVLKTAGVAFQFADTDGSGEIDFKEMFTMMKRMVDKAEEPLEEVRAMFERFDEDEDGVLTYEEFLLLLAECPTDSALFTGLLSFAEDAVASGVGSKLRSPSVRALARQQSHVLDDGSMAWRQSIEAAFDLCDADGGGTISRDEALVAVERYPLIAQLLRMPVDLNDEEQLEYMRCLCEQIDVDGENGIDRAEWVGFFCAAKVAVPQAKQWDAQSTECQQISGYIFDMDGTLYQPSGLVPGAEDVLSWLERSGAPYALLSNTGAKPNTAVQRKLSAAPFECRPNGSPVPLERIYTAADAQVDFLLSGHLPAGSRLVVVAPDDRWREMLVARDDEGQFGTWEVRSTLDLDTAKEWAMHARESLARHEAAKAAEAEAAARAAGDAPPFQADATPHAAETPKVAVVVFSDGTVAGGWSDELVHALTIVLHFGADFIFTAEDPVNPSVDPRYPGVSFPSPGPGMFVDMLRKSMPPGADNSRTFCCGKGGNVGRKFFVDKAVKMLQEQGHSGRRDEIMIVGDRFDTDVRAGVLAGIKSCLLESGAHTLDMADEFPTDLPSYTCASIADLLPKRERAVSAQQQQPPPQQQQTMRVGGI